MTDKPNYYAVIPAEVRYDKGLIPNAKLLYAEITSLCNKEGFCWASNKYFADLYQVQQTTISAWIKQLTEKGYIKSEVLKNYSRKIFIRGVSGFPEGGFGKNRRGVSGKAEKNNKVISKINKGADKPFKERVQEYKPFKQILREKMSCY